MEVSFFLELFRLSHDFCEFTKSDIIFAHLVIKNLFPFSSIFLSSITKPSSIENPQVDTLKWETDASLQVDTLTSKETYRAELAIAVKETSDALEALRNSLLNQPKDDANSEELANAAKEIAKAGAKPAQTLELAKHLSELLLTECDATEQDAMLKEVESLSLRYEDLLAQAKKRELQINSLR